MDGRYSPAYSNLQRSRSFEPHIRNFAGSGLTGSTGFAFRLQQALHLRHRFVVWHARARVIQGQLHLGAKPWVMAACWCVDLECGFNGGNTVFMKWRRSPWKEGHCVCATGWVCVL